MSPASIPACGGIELAVRGGWVLRVHLSDGGPLPWVGALIAIPPLRSVGFRFSFCYVASSPLSVCLPLAWAVMSSRECLLTHLDRVQLRARPDAMLVTIDVGYCGMQSKRRAF